MTVSPAETLRLRLAGRGVAWAGALHYLDVVDSTNSWLRDELRRGATSWTVAWAGMQTAGRGRQGRSWASPRSGLYVSVLMDMPALVDPSRPGAIALLAGVAVARGLAEVGLEVRLKWPNDVRVGGRKVAGILAEAVSDGPRRMVVVGIGINCDCAHEDLAADLRDTATSVAIETGRPCEPGAVCAAVLAHLTVCYDALAQQGQGAIVEEWRRWSEPWWGCEVEVASGAERWRGIALDVQADGALWVDRFGVGCVAVHSGEVTRLRLAGEVKGGDGTA